ncbi:MAG: hypothetical protein U1F43_37225 [Myxococcota bacterium]
MSHFVSFGVVLALVFGGCGSKGPGDELAPVLRGLGDPGGPTVSRTRTLYDALDTVTRAAVDARAAAMSTALGRKVAPVEAIQFRGFDPTLRVSDVEVVDEGDERASLRVSLARIDTSVPGPNPDALTFVAVREDGHWKLSLPELATVVAQAPTSQPANAAPAVAPTGIR